MKREEIARYLSALLGVRVIVVALHVLGGSNEGGDIKSYGYRTPVRVDYQIAGSERKSVVLHTMSPGPFGHEHMADRAQELIWENQAFNHLPRHIRSHPLFPAGVLERIEHLCVAWRWRLKYSTHRLRQVRGEFHPWNIVFRSDTEFSLLDRSRGEFGDAADDVASLTMNYLFFALQRSGCLEGALASLFLRFWERYFEKSGDREMLNVVGPFLDFRGLVMASPLWYPALPDAVRRRILSFILAVLETDSFDPQKTNLLLWNLSLRKLSQFG